MSGLGRRSPMESSLLPPRAIARTTGAILVGVSLAFIGIGLGIMHWSERGVGEFALLVMALGVGGLMSAASM